LNTDDTDWQLISASSLHSAKSQAQRFLRNLRAICGKKSEQNLCELRDLREKNFAKTSVRAPRNHTLKKNTNKNQVFSSCFKPVNFNKTNIIIHHKLFIINILKFNI
jgi:hypothetical protein